MLSCPGEHGPAAHDDYPLRVLAMAARRARSVVAQRRVCKPGAPQMSMTPGPLGFRAAALACCDRCEVLDECRRFAAAHEWHEVTAAGRYYGRNGRPASGAVAQERHERTGEVDAAMECQRTRR